MEITRIRRPARDARTGSPSGPAEEDALVVLAVAPVDGGDAEIADYGRDGAREVLRIFTRDAEVDLLPTDEVVIDGVTFRVAGFPKRWVSPFGGPKGATVDVWRAVG